MGLSKIVRDSLNTGIDDNSDATAITIDSSEKVGIGDTSPLGNKVHIRTAGSATSVNGDAGLVLESDDSTRCDLQFMGPDGAFQSIYFGDVSDDNRGIIAYSHSGNNMRFTVDASERMRLTADGLTFNGDTAAANALNDYETGTWTPTFLASGTNPTVNSVGNGTGYYVKVGDIVHFSYYTSAMNIGSAGSGAAYVGNLPFTSSNGSNEYWLFQYVHGTAIGSSVTGGYINNNQNAITFILPNSTSGVSWTAGSPQYMMIAGSYRAA